MNIVKYFILLLNVTGLYAIQKWHLASGANYIAKRMEEYAATHGRSTSTTKWIEQPLDHFDRQEKRTWKMRYFENLEFFKPNGPIYLFIYGEAEANATAFKSLYLYDLANETNGAMYIAEHRYYGESIPLNTSVVKNMKYLSSEQALADLNNLIQTIKSSPNFERSKVAVIGGSYGGNLAAWMRVKYPDAVDAAWASSAPVLAKKNFFEYIEKVGEDYKNYGGDVCYEKMKKIFNRYDKLLQSVEGIEKLKKELNICNHCNLKKSLNKMSFFLNMIDPFMSNAQNGTLSKFKTHCSKLINGNTSDFLETNTENPWLHIDAKANMISKFKTGKDSCHDYGFQKFVNSSKMPSWNSWFYQTCTEFGYYMTTDSKRQPFTRNLGLDLYIKSCSFLYGPEYNEHRVDKGVAHTNKQYGGQTPNVTRVVFVNGGADPWNTLGVLTDLSDDAPARVIPDHHHCSDMFASHSEDANELIEARKYVKGLLKKWLGLN